jgi:hypothetical protein
MRMFPIRRLVVRVSVAAGACFLCACSVLTIDVDVYKGPLVNEPDVQLQQVAVMPIAAKMLIAEFRDHAEIRALERRGGSVKDYQEIDEIRRGRALNGHRFKSRDAGRANEVLSLYDNRIANQAIRALIDRYIGAVGRYATGWAVLRPSDPLTLSNRERLATELGLRVGDLSWEEGQKLMGTETPRRLEQWEAQLALRQLLVPSVPKRSESGRYVFADQVLQRWTLERGTTEAKPLVERGSFYRNFDDFQEAKRLISSLVQPTISERSVDESALKVAEVAQAFTQCRLAIESLLETTLRLIIEINEDRDITDTVKRDVNKHLAEAATDLISKTQYNDAKGLLQAAPRGPGMAFVEPSSKAELRSALDRRLVTHEDVGAALRSPVVERVAQSAKTLLDFHEFAKRSGETGLEHGIATGPMSNPSTLLTPDRAREIFGLVRVNLGGAFGEGRYDAGLTTMIEMFLGHDKARHDGSIRDCLPPADPQVSVLLDALVQFGEKLTYLANNAALTAGDANDANDANDAKDQDVRLLQAVGNSILVQVNEIRARQTHGESEKARAKALQSAFKGGEPKDEERPTQVIDRIILCHTAKRIKDLADGKPVEAAQRQNAIEELEKLRARYVYIRPPSFYLKNSYPVTSYQQNAGQEWKNMLQEQSLRSIPFADVFSPSRKTRKAMRIQTEIDKQFWQNINRVRVAGGGFTNYVVAKDDVGNWYIKNYSADPSDIIEAAKQAAMFAAAPTAPLTAAAEAGKLKDLPQGQQAKNGARNGPVVESLGKYKAEEEAARRKTLEGIHAMLTGDVGEARLKALLKDDKFTTFDKLPDLAARTLEVAKEKFPEGINAAKTERVMDLLVGIDRLRAMLLARIERLPDADWKSGRTPAEARKEARAIVHQVLTLPLRNLVHDRIAALNRHRDRVSVLSDVAAQK